jgi:hypothetical protein
MGGLLFLRDQRVIGIIDQTSSVAKLAPPLRQAPEGRKENSPGRKPGIGSESSVEPRRGDRERLRTKIFRPYRGSFNAIS